MNIKSSKIYLTILILFLLSCKTELKDNYFNIRFNLPDYYKRYDFRQYAKKNNISLLFRGVDETEVFYKDSINQSFLNFQQYDKNHIKFRTDFKKLIDEIKITIEEEQLAKWTNISIRKKDGFDFAILEFKDTVSQTYNNSTYWKTGKDLYRLSFYTNFNNEYIITDFKKMIEEMKFSKNLTQ